MAILFLNYIVAGIFVFFLLWHKENKLGNRILVVGIVLTLLRNQLFYFGYLPGYSVRFQLYTLLQIIVLGIVSYFLLRCSRALAQYREARKNRKPRLSPAELATQTDRFIQCFESEQLHLNPKLRLSTIATKMSLRPDQVSEIFTMGMSTTFFDFVNQRRVLEAQRRLIDPAYAHLSIMEIATECGFNSKSTFADAFRKWTGQAPSEYRESKTPTIGIIKE